MGVLTTRKPSFAVVRTLCVCRKPIPLRMFWISKKRSCVSKKACGREPGSTGLLAAIESPLGITRAVEIAHASERLIGIALGAEDYVRNLRTERSPGRN